VDVLAGESILCFAPDPWSDIWRNRHQIMSRLAPDNTVLYVEPRPYLRDVLRGGVAVGDWGPQLSRAACGVHLFRPARYAPISARTPLKQMTATMRDGQVRAAMRRLGMTAPILWLFRPEMADVPGRYGEQMLIYHIVDEYTGYEGLGEARRQAIEQRECGLIARADLVLVTSRELLVTKGGINTNTHWVPNGVDWEAFLRAMASDDPEPAVLDGCAHPRLAYVGAINDKVDTELLLRVADAYPACTLVLVGPETAQRAESRADLEALRRQKNVRIVGRVDVAEVPRFIKACDVGLLPYRQNAWTRHIHPLKLYEYLACGLPVVATDIPSLRDEQEHVRICDGAAAFVAALPLVWAENGLRERAARQQRARCNTWQQRVERISELVELTRTRQISMGYEVGTNE
jgi:glycosyltransferase involved in cell wall biosynthesis